MNLLDMYWNAGSTLGTALDELGTPLGLNMFLMAPWSLFAITITTASIIDGLVFNPVKD